MASPADKNLEEIFLLLPGPMPLACASFYRVITERAYLACAAMEVGQLLTARCPPTASCARSAMVHTEIGHRPLPPPLMQSPLSRRLAQGLDAATTGASCVGLPFPQSPPLPRVDKDGLEEASLMDVIEGAGLDGRNRGRQNPGGAVAWPHIVPCRRRVVAIFSAIEAMKKGHEDGSYIFDREGAELLVKHLMSYIRSMPEKMVIADNGEATNVAAVWFGAVDQLTAQPPETRSVTITGPSERQPMV